MIAQAPDTTFTLAPALIFNKKLKTYYFESNRTFELTTNEPKYVRDIRVLDSLSLNGQLFRDLVISHETYYLDFNICSVHFLHLFSKMYYYPKEKKITLVFPDKKKI